ncbi:DUF4097 family beta strand repeat-containing protein [Lactobacillus sp. ESL0677]|uniref:DUF4097 family beta strand repeat-containing protein n=1 Tax=Lactobacillus sp. ESL0677 TaxID=2983208 RepID=UPI0023F97AF8|nr:DUF4097 family beta strand repeat-containing protein [Lactobacillus sp. ESL0677]WEV36675.1 DUF4097 family beta strand repeat-containing protein [Lactobacillus sp. ESL0677]
MMKRFYKIGAATLIIGLILTIAGYINGGLQPVVGTDLTNFQVLDAKTFSHTRTLSYKKFSQVELNTGEVDYRIHRGNKYQIKVNDTKEHLLVVNKVKDKIVIGQRHQTYPITIDWKFYKQRPEVEITVPTKAALTKIEDNNTQGSLKVSDLNLKKLIVDIADYNEQDDLQLHNLQVERAQISTDMSDTDIDNCTFNNSKFDLDNCVLEMNKLVVKKKLVANIVGGDFETYSSEFHHGKISDSDGEVLINKSIVDTMKFSLDQVDLNMSRNKFTGKNTFGLKQSSLIMKHNPANINYDLLTTGEGQIKFRGKKVHRSSANYTKFNKKVANSVGTIKAEASDDDIVIK